MIEQHEEQHEREESPSLKVELVKKCRKLLERQVLEGVKIDRFKGIIINRKGEWGQNLPPNFTIEGQGDTQRYNNKSRTIATKRDMQVKESDEGRKRAKMSSEDVPEEVLVENERENGPRDESVQKEESTVGTVETGKEEKDKTVFEREQVDVTDERPDPESSNDKCTVPDGDVHVQSVENWSKEESPGKVMETHRRETDTIADESVLLDKTDERTDPKSNMDRLIGESTVADQSICDGIEKLNINTIRKQVCLDHEREDEMSMCKSTVHCTVDQICTVQ